MGENILGCFVSTESTSPDTNGVKVAKKKGELFRSYIWGDQGICHKLKTLKSIEYGEDLNLALFQFYVAPSSTTISYLKEIESYRKKEKAIGIPIIVNDENFFSKSEDERYTFLKDTILDKMDLLEAVVKRRKLDTNMDKLKADVAKLSFFP